MTKHSAIFAILSLAAGAALAGETPSAPGAKVSFANLKNGEIVASPVHVQFALTGMTIAPAGTETPNTGHHHLFIDAPADPKTFNDPIPTDAQHLHFGKGQTEADVPLTPGTHTLQLVLGDWTHIPHKPPVVSEQIHITVK